MAIVTISRETASGGRALAERLAVRLGYPCLAREVLLAAARELGASVDDLEERLETSPTAWTRLWHERDGYILALQTALLDLAADGSLVYHGLAGHCLMQGVPCLLRVRVVAPLEMRVRSLLRDHRDVPPDAAVEFIRTADRESRHWVKLIYGADLEDPALYDVTVNLRTTTVDSACSAIAALVATPQFDVTERVRADLRAAAASCRERLCAEARRP